MLARRDAIGEPGALRKSSELLDRAAVLFWPAHGAAAESKLGVLQALAFQWPAPSAHARPKASAFARQNSGPNHIYWPGIILAPHTERSTLGASSA